MIDGVRRSESTGKFADLKTTEKGKVHGLFEKTNKLAIQVFQVFREKSNR
jgi:hypothetical protein